MQKYSLKSDNIQDVTRKCSVALKKPGAFLLVPTETVYGFVCSWDDSLARKNICEAKKRPREKLFQMLASDLGMVKVCGGIISPIVEKIVHHFCPGPITIVIPAKSGGTIGFRIPEYAFILELIKKHKSPLAGTSANISGEPPALSPNQVLPELTLKPDIVVDAGVFFRNATPSTVLKITNDQLEILREDPISLKEIEETQSIEL